MLKIKIIIVIMISVIPFAYTQNANEIIGKYSLPNKLDIEIFEYKSKFYGKIIALNGYQNGQTVDFKNPNKTKQKDSLIGKIIITGLEYNKEDKQWINGRMYGPEKGMYFNLMVKDISENEIEIEASKYFFWKTLKWKKI